MKLIDKLMEVWITATVILGIVTLSTGLASELIYPHLADNPKLASALGLDETLAQKQRIKSAQLVSLAILLACITAISFIALLIVAPFYNRLP